MDRERAILLADGEVKRREALAKMGGCFAKDHLEMASALREILEAYQNPSQASIPVFQTNNIRLEEKKSRGVRS